MEKSTSETSQPEASPPAPLPRPSIWVRNLAFTALVLAILAFIPAGGVYAGILSVILAMIAIRKSVARKMAIVALVMAAVALLVVQPIAISLFVDIHHPNSRGECSSNLNGIGKAMALYSSNNDDLMPPDLEVLVRANLISQSILRCPGLKSARQTDYFYLPPGPDGDSRSIMACDLKNNHKGEGRNVLRASYAVEWMAEPKFQKELQGPCNATFAQALREAEGP